MATSVYKSARGQAQVESYYRNILKTFNIIPFQQLYIPSSAGTTHVIRCGDVSKPALILLHGSMSNSATWLGILEDFADSFSLYCVDIPGEPGLSDPTRMPLGSGKPAEWLESVLDNLGLKSALFLAMSLGSWYALRFAIDNPLRTEALSMITASGLAPQKSSFLLKAIFFMLLGTYGQRSLNRAVYHKTQVPLQVLEFQALVSSNFNPVTETVPLFADEELKRLTMPVQYFGGDSDALLDTKKSAARLSALLPESEINVLEDTGHVIVDQFAAAKAFLSQGESRTDQKHFLQP